MCSRHTGFYKGRLLGRVQYIFLQEFLPNGSYSGGKDENTEFFRDISKSQLGNFTSTPEQEDSDVTSSPLEQSSYNVAYGRSSDSSNTGMGERNKELTRYS